MTFQPRLLSGGRICCSAEHALCDACQAHHGLSSSQYLAIQSEWLRLATETVTFAPPVDAYTAALATLRAATVSPESEYEKHYKSERLAAFHAEHVEADRRAAAWRAAEQASSEHVESYAPPDSYKAGLAKMRSENK